MDKLTKEQREFGLKAYQAYLKANIESMQCMNNIELGETPYDHL